MKNYRLRLWLPQNERLSRAKRAAARMRCREDMAKSRTAESASPPSYAVDLQYYRIVCYLVRSPALVFISAIGEIASAYVIIAVSNRVKRMRNGNLN